MKTKQYHHGDLKNALVQAGIDLLSEEGIGGLTLRKAASRAGVSHSAPYAHFADKQALIAAICTEGLRQLDARIDLAIESASDDPAQMLEEVAWAYVQFALEFPAYYKLIFSGALEKEHNYPEYVETSHKSFQRLVRLVEQFQSAGVLGAGDADSMAVSLWSFLHGFTGLLLERQISHSILERYELKDLLCLILAQIIRKH